LLPPAWHETVSGASLALGASLPASIPESSATAASCAAPSAPAIASGGLPPSTIQLVKVFFVHWPCWQESLQWVPIPLLQTQLHPAALLHGGPPGVPLSMQL
jgi:hypothetical protein